MTGTDIVHIKSMLWLKFERNLYLPLSFQTSGKQKMVQSHIFFHHLFNVFKFHNQFERNSFFINSTRFYIFIKFLTNVLFQGKMEKGKMEKGNMVTA